MSTCLIKMVGFAIKMEYLTILLLDAHRERLRY
jgi:hypothetical protein